MADTGDDPRVAGLSAAIARLRAELDAYPARLYDRHAAEDELTALAARVAEGAPTADELRNSLLQILAAIGSVSALADALTALRNAMELFGEPLGFQGAN
ncbi:DUF5955 family protein [Streptomyces sp. WMMB 322]|uniref:DUF5955 family protein n=1 Tax=Streptomyces sp. WMMB 322 TaxID=1286821 RepID=UPI000823A53B|nr:DUF5955 family protein [Streptomyces sp. WMMB 322]SCK42436.1 hypothetical protein H180DRAFT_03692 [Streptomyces sp. WMMB 322]